MSAHRLVATVLLCLAFSSAGPLTIAQVSFSNPVSYPVGTAPAAVAVGDFNGDGKPDLAVVNSSSGSVSILLGKGDGTFQSALTYHVSDSPLFAAVGDFNGDHRLDLAVANGSENTVSILMGNGDGTFQSPLQDNLGGFAGYVAVADFNGDGKVDLLALNNQLSTTGENTIGILLGNGDGTFQSVVTSSFSTDGFTPSKSAAVGDFNGDGRADVAVGSGTLEGETGRGNLVILLGNGDGTFQPVPAFDLGFRPLYLAAGSFTAEGKIDLAVAARENVFGSDIKILLGNGDGTFSLAPNSQTGTQGYGFGDSSVAVADVNHDGKLDAIGLESVDPDYYPMGIQIMLGRGNGTFQNPVPNPCNQSSDCVQLSFVADFLASGDFNGDGLPDLVVANVFANTVSIFLNRTPNAAPQPDFSLSPASANLTVQPGGQVSDVITLTQQNGTFGSIVQLSCAVAGPSPIPTCAVSPPSVTPGAGSVTSTLTITAPAAIAMQLHPSYPQLSKSLYALGLPVLFGIAVVGGSKTKHRRHWLCCGLLLLLLVLQTACGGKTASPTNYTVTVTGASGAIEHTTQVIVTVQ